MCDPWGSLSQSKPTPLKIVTVSAKAHTCQSSSVKTQHALRSVSQYPCPSSFVRQNLHYFSFYQDLSAKMHIPKVLSFRMCTCQVLSDKTHIYEDFLVKTYTCQVLSVKKAHLQRFLGKTSNPSIFFQSNPKLSSVFSQNSHSPRFVSQICNHQGLPVKPTRTKVCVCQKLIL